MSFIGSFSKNDEPDEGYIDDQSMQEDHSDNKFVGPAIDTACAVYDSMFSALKYMIRGKADVLSKMDSALNQLEARCKEIADKYREILGKIPEAGASFSESVGTSIGKDAFTLLDSNPVLRRYIGEANYWVLWDTLATLSSQGAPIGADVSDNLKGAVKGTIQALLSMTNGLMHYESYLSQLTQLWGWLYAKEIWLPLTDSICPQVTCAYFYKPADDGQLEGSAPSNTGLDKDNPVPGSDAFAPMPVPIFDTVHNSASAIASFKYDDPDTWKVLTSESRAAFQKAYKYWRSNYTNATSISSLLSAASSKLTGGRFKLGFGQRKRNHPLGTPLRVGHTFSQLYTKKNESFPITLYEDDLISAFEKVDAAFMALLDKMASPEIITLRDDRLTEKMADAADKYVGAWAYNGQGVGINVPEDDSLAWDVCYEIVAGLSEFGAFMAAIADLGSAYNFKYSTPYNTVPVQNWGRPYNNSNKWQSPPLEYLAQFLSGIQADAPTRRLSAVLDTFNSNDPGVHGFELGLPYAFYTNEPARHSGAIYECIAEYIAHGHELPLYSAAAATMSFELDVDTEIGRKIDGGRMPLYAAIGVYGNLLGLFPWDYKVVGYDSFREKYTRIKGSYRIYYKNDNPSEVIFADNIMRVGMLKYIATCKASASDTISRGAESYTAYIFPSETCSVYSAPPQEEMLGNSVPNFASLQRVDAVDPNDGTQYMYDLTRNAIPRWPKYVDPEKWSIMDLIHELWLLADSLAPLCGDGGKRQAELSELLNELGLTADGPRGGPRFVGQLPADDGDHVRIEFTVMNAFAARLKTAINSVYALRDDLIAATRDW